MVKNWTLRVAAGLVMALCAAGCRGGNLGGPFGPAGDAGTDAGVIAILDNGFDDAGSIDDGALEDCGGSCE